MSPYLHEGSLFDGHLAEFEVAGEREALTHHHVEREVAKVTWQQETELFSEDWTMGGREGGREGGRGEGGREGGREEYNELRERRWQF